MFVLECWISTTIETTLSLVYDGSGISGTREHSPIWVASLSTKELTLIPTVSLFAHAANSVDSFSVPESLQQEKYWIAESRSDWSWDQASIIPLGAPPSKSPNRSKLWTEIEGGYWSSQLLDFQGLASLRSADKRYQPPLNSSLDEKFNSLVLLKAKRHSIIWWTLCERKFLQWLSGRLNLIEFGDSDTHCACVLRPRIRRWLTIILLNIYIVWLTLRLFRCR